MSNTVSFFCLVYREPFSRAFPVEINKETSIGVLKEVIKEKKKPEFDSFAADRLQLWKVDIKAGDREELEKFEPEGAKPYGGHWRAIPDTTPKALCIFHCNSPG
jgi:hypothetical protein